MSGDVRLDSVVHTSGALRCLECGKCTAICPVARYDGGFSPRRTVGRASAHEDDDLLRDDRLWACLNCLQCSEVCPAKVDYAALTTAVRTEARRHGQVVLCTHGEAIHVWMRMMTQPELKQDRLGWLESDHRPLTADRNCTCVLRAGNYDLQTCSDSDTLYFAGCAPYYDALFAPLGIEGTRVAQASVQILNALGIRPQVLADERCCGHDFLWEGDAERFTQLARLNADMVRAAGVKRIVSACPECVRTLKVDYPAYGVPLNVQIVHLTELVAGTAK